MGALRSAAGCATRFPLWGGEASVAVTDGGRLDDALGAVRAVTEDFDRACSPFRPDSELAAVNRGAGAPVAIGPVLASAIGAALDAAALTDGAVDPTIGGATLALGLDGPQRPGPAYRVRAIRVPGWQTVDLEPDGARVRIPHGARLDLGATAKALAADEAATSASAAAGCGVLVSLLGDLAIAGPPSDDGWLVRVTDDHRSGPGAAGQTIVLRDGGLATSSRTVRRSPRDPALHHLLDPLTARAADGPWRTVSIHAASCLDANILSTALMVGGYRAESLLTAEELPARLVQTNGTVEHRHAWPVAGETGYRS
jgi:thiamine biosynthesis lipoprotein